MILYTVLLLNCHFLKYFRVFYEISFIDSNTMLYYLVLTGEQMTNIKSKSKTQKLSFKLAPYLFIAVTIFTAFGSTNGTWV